MTQITSSSMRLPQGYYVRPARPEDCPLLPVVERASTELFRGTGLVDFEGPEETLARPQKYFDVGAATRLLWVAETSGKEVVGFALCEIIEGNFYLTELSVHPSHGRKGLGRVLTLTICQAARERYLLPVYLSTFRNVPWNAPFYARLGFKEVSRDDYSTWMHEREATHAQTMDIRKRCFMRWDGA
jgi:ribosomal protein S18 acetylase RimI-like enzyme